MTCSICLAGTTGEEPDEAYVKGMDQIELAIINGRHEEALQLIKEGEARFPEKEFGFDFLRAVAFGFLGRQAEGLTIWKKGHGNGYFFNINPEHPWYRNYKNTNGFEEILKKDGLNKKKFNESSKLRYDVVLPEDFDAEKSYPVLFVFHGGGCNIPVEKSRWHNPSLVENWITVYLQSHCYITSEACIWINDRQTREELLKVYQELSSKYSFKDGQIIAGGMSNGGMMALQVAFKDLIEVNGFIVNCPVVPDSITRELVKRAKKQNKRGVIITGSKDWSLKNQKDLKALMDEESFPSTMEVIEGMGHDTPEDFAERVDRALMFFTEKNGGTKSTGKLPESATLNPDCTAFVSNDGKTLLFSSTDQTVDEDDTRFCFSFLCSD